MQERVLQPEIVSEEDLAEDGGDTVSLSTEVSTPLACSVVSTPQSSAHDSTFVLDTPEATTSGEFYGGNGVFLATTKQVYILIEHSWCSTPGCNGTLKRVSTKLVGLGGDAEMVFHCTGCVQHKVTYSASVVHENSGQPSLSLSLQVACICAGLSYAQYKRLFGAGLGTRCVSSRTFYKTVQFLFSPSKDILDH